MAEFGIIASVVQIADVGLRLSINLYTFGEIVASADRSIISISKDVSLTSGVLKELGQILDKDRETGTFSENAVQTADGVVKECLEVFQEMENILVKKLPSLGGGGKEGRGGERARRAMVLLERLKWGFLQPKLQLLRSNLDRLKSTLLLMLNVITYARQVSEKTESPSVIAEQRSLIEDLAHSNQEYIRDFERLKLAIGGPAVEHGDDASNILAAERQSSTLTNSLLGAPTLFATGGIPLEDRENTRGLGSKGLTTSKRSSPTAQSSMVRSLATLSNAGVKDLFLDTSVQPNIEMPPVQERRRPPPVAPMEFDQEFLFKQLEHYSRLIKNLLKEVDEAHYKITFKSRLRMKGGIADLHEGERRELERLWGCTALHSAEQRLDPLVESREESPGGKRFAAHEASTNDFSSSAGISQLFNKDPFSQDPDKWPSLFDESDEGFASMRKEKRPLAFTKEDPNNSVAVRQAGNATVAQNPQVQKMEPAKTLEAEAKPWESATASIGTSFGGSVAPYTVPYTKQDGIRGKRAYVPAQTNTLAIHNPSLSPLASERGTTLRQGVRKKTRNFSPPQPASIPSTSVFIDPLPEHGWSDVAASSISIPNGSKAGEGNGVPVTCSNCSTKITSLWRQDREGRSLCNACGSFVELHGVVRPLSKKRKNGNTDIAISGYNSLEAGVNESYSMPFNSDHNNPDILENFDFEKFLPTTDAEFNFDPSSFESGPNIEMQPEAEPEGLFADLEGCIINESGMVEDKHGNIVGSLVEGNLIELVGRAVWKSGDIVNDYGNVVGYAEPYEKPEEEIVDLSSLEGKVVNDLGQIVDERGTVFGRIANGDIKMLAGKEVDGNGQIWNDGQKVNGQAELLPGGGTKTPRVQSAELKKVVVKEDVRRDEIRTTPLLSSRNHDFAKTFAESQWIPSFGDVVSEGLKRDRILELAEPERPNVHQMQKRVQRQADTFQCTLCPKKFTRAYNLRSHLWTHTGERPIPHEVCGDTFARQYDLKRHRALHSEAESQADEIHLGSDVDLISKPSSDPDPSTRLVDSLEWPLDRVLTWLAANSFSNDWQRTFESLDICGAEFLDLGRGNGDLGLMNQTVYPRLAKVCTENGTGWDQVRKREEEMRMRRAIQELVRGAESSKTAPKSRLEALSIHTPPLRVIQPVSACQKCQSADIKCDGKLPACTACEEAMQNAECSMTGEQRPVTPREADENKEHRSVTPTDKTNQQCRMAARSLCSEYDEISSPGSMYHFQTIAKSHSPDTQLKGGQTATEAVSDATLDIPLGSTHDDIFEPDYEDDFFECRSPKPMLAAFDSDFAYDTPIESAFSRIPDLRSSPESEQGASKMADMEVVDRLVSLWTTVKPL